MLLKTRFFSSVLVVIFLLSSPVYLSSGIHFGPISAIKRKVQQLKDKIDNDKKPQQAQDIAISSKTFNPLMTLQLNGSASDDNFGYSVDGGADDTGSYIGVGAIRTDFGAYVDMGEAHLYNVYPDFDTSISRNPYFLLASVQKHTVFGGIKYTV